MSPVVMGIDPGKWATGIALLDYETGSLAFCAAITPERGLPHNATLAWIRDGVAAVVALHDPIDIWVEDGIVRGSGTSTRVLAEVAGVINAATGFRCQTLNITEIKKHATGKGNATKAAMAEAGEARWPGAFDHLDPKHREHAIDAAWTASLGLSISHKAFNQEEE